MIKQLHFNDCDSTQDILKEQLSLSTLKETFLISCNSQNNGRGRGDNKWIQLEGTLCFSMNLSPHKELSLTALEISLLITKFFEGSILSLKWPNDILNKDQKKTAGVLIQGHQGILMTGIGINLHSTHETWGGVYDSSFEFDKKAWSLELTKFILQNRYQNTQKLIQDWQDKCSHMGSKVLISENQETIEGIFLGLGKFGEAIIKNGLYEKKIYNGTLKIL